MVQWVYEASLAANVAEKVVVATPDQEIVGACKSFGAEAILTSPDHQTGTDRIAEVAQKIQADVYVNVQGDEPLIRPSSIAACATPLLKDDRKQMGSVFSFCAQEELDNPAVVKVVTDKQGYALYFSRYPIPFARNPRPEAVKKHIGLYAFRCEPLLKFATWPLSALEKAESLEQLRFMENGVRIYMAEAEGSELAVDTPEQAEQVREILGKHRKLEINA